MDIKINSFLELLTVFSQCV